MIRQLMENIHNILLIDGDKDIEEMVKWGKEETCIMLTNEERVALTWTVRKFLSDWHKETKNLKKIAKEKNKEDGVVSFLTYQEKTIEAAESALKKIEPDKMFSQR